MTMLPEILAQPLYLQLWILWLVVVNSASLFFLRRIEARWVLVAWIINAILMTVLFEWQGFTRLLGLSHIVCWTPLLIYLGKQKVYRRRGQMYATWLKALFWSDLVALAIDYADVARYLLGNRAPLA